MWSSLAGQRLGPVWPCRHAESHQPKASERWGQPSLSLTHESESAGNSPCCGPCGCVGMAGGKYRSFLVHMKAMGDRSVDESPRPVLRMPSSRPQGSKAHSLSNLLQRAQAPKVQ